MGKTVGAIIQARTGSTRLPGKVLKKISGKTVLEHVIERVKQVHLLDKIIIATTELQSDNKITELAKISGVRCFMGSEEDVLERYYYAARENRLDIVVRITSDCPLIDPKLCDEIIYFYLGKSKEYVLVTNAGPGVEERTYPRGLDVEVFSFTVLEEAFKQATEIYQREHVTPWIYENYSGRGKVSYFKNEINYAYHRWTLDTEEDFLLIREIYDRLYKGKHDFFWEDILKVFENEPELFKINMHVKQKG